MLAEAPLGRSRWNLVTQTNRPGRCFLFMDVNVKLTLAALILLLLSAGCGGDEADFPEPDLSGIDVNLTVLRFDAALATADTNGVAEVLAQLDGDFGTFADDYFRHLVPLRRGDFGPDEQTEVFRAFLTYPLVRESLRLTGERFDEAVLTDFEAELEQALRRYRYFLPEAPVPDTLVTYVSQFQYAGFLYGEGQLAVGLDFFLGPDFDYQSVDPRDPVFSDYLTQAYTPKHLSAKMLRLLLDDYVPRPRAGRLVDYLVYEGKKLYLLNRLLPGVDDHIIHEVTPEQMEWLRANETAIFAQLQREDQFYATDPTLIRKLTQPAPYTQGMPRESPGRAVNYLGQQIVEAFVRANPNVDTAGLLEIGDGQEILRRARYRPR